MDSWVGGRPLSVEFCVSRSMSIGLERDRGEKVETGVLKITCFGRVSCRCSTVPFTFGCFSIKQYNNLEEQLSSETM